MDRTVQLEQKIAPVLEDFNVRLYELKWLSGKEKTLQIAIMKEDGSMDLDTCAAVSEKISELLDDDPALNEAYTLEVCSPGAEREIRDLNELRIMPEPYVYVRLRHPVKKMIEFTGTITAIDENDTVTLAYRDKAARRTAELSLADIEFIRLAVKI